VTRAPHLLRSLTVCTALSGTLALALAVPAGAATSGAPTVFNTETVSAQLSPNGSVDTARLFNQLVVTGDGTATIADPTSSKGLRALDGFSGPEVRDDMARYDIDVSGSEERRTVADFPKDRLPVTVEAEYRLDGVQVSAADLVGKSGELEVRYTVENVTGEPTEISFIDFQGKTVNKTVDVVTPYVGQLTTTLPASFRELRSNRADIAGDGRGGHQVAFTMALFTPIGANQHVLSYTAQVTDAELPPAHIQLVPVEPERKPELAFGQRGFEEGAASAATLAGGAGQVDAGLLALQAGASKLLGGLTQLRDGANQLNAGLEDTAVPGANKLADGLDQLDTGAGSLSNGLGELSTGATSLRAGLLRADAGATQLSGGLDQLDTGAGSLANGLGDARTGAQSLSSGLGQLDDGAGTLSAGLGELREKAAPLGQGTADLATGAAALAAGISQIQDGVDALPTSIQENPGFKQLKTGLQRIAAGIGEHDDTEPTTLLGGLNALGFGLRGPAGRTEGKDPSPRCDTTPESKQEACGVADGIELVQEGLDEAAKTPNDGLEGVVQDAITAYRAVGCPPAPDGASPVPGVLPPNFPGLPPACAATSKVAFGLALPAGISRDNPDGGVLAQTRASKANLQVAADNLEELFEAVDKAILPGLKAIKGQLSGDVNANGEIDTYKDATRNEVPGIKEGQFAISAGIDTLVQGISTNISTALGTAEAGANRLAVGTEQLAGSAPSLLAGIGQLDAGGSRLAAGLDSASTGSRRLATGLVAADTGAQRLAAGIGDASEGGSSLAVGLGTASTGSGKLAAGLVSADSGGQRLATGLTDAANGGQRLADGLVSAADGSAKIADGLEQAAPGARALADGAGQASETGTKRLVAGGAAASAANAERAAIMRALGEKGAAALPYGAPEGATGTAAYDLVLAGASSDTRDNTTRGVAALGLLGLASLGGFALRRRQT